jgi:lysozyme
MNLGKNGLELIKSFEGFSDKAYPDPATHAEPYTIGYGTTVYPNGSKVKLGDTCTIEQAEKWLAFEVESKCIPVIQKKVGIPLTQNQLDACISFIYNCGATNFSNSTLLILLNASKFDLAAAEFLRWDKAAGKVIAGLTRRREAEKKLFLTT